MSQIDLKLAQHVLKGADSQAGLGYLEYYSGHNVYHPGWDLNFGYGADDFGSPVNCPAEGVVIYVSPKPTRLNRHNGGLGWFTVIYHTKLGLYSRWMHLNKVHVTEKQVIPAGHWVGDLGKTGTSSPHIHFDVVKDILVYHKSWRPYAFYPSNWSKLKVAQYFVDPAEFIQSSLDLQKPKPLTKNNMIVVKRRGDPQVYLTAGDRIIHIDLAWEDYLRDFRDATIIELSQQEFNKLTVLDLEVVKK